MDSQDLYTYQAMRCVSAKEQQQIKAIFTNPSGKRGAVASLGGGATTKSKSNGGDTANHSMCYHHQGFSKNCSIPLNLKLNGGKINGKHKQLN